jgi:hypothetical protein
MGAIVKCPVCGADDFDLARYESMMVLSEGFAIFTLPCPHCATKVSSVCAIPHTLQSQIETVANQLNCGMGRETPSL